MQLDEYLRRVRLEWPLPPTAGTLRRLHVAHLAAFTFNNVEIQRGGRIAVDLGSIERKFLAGLAGGYCFEHNTLLAAVLRKLGFSVTTILAHAGPADMRALTHLILHVEIDRRRWLADVGFGGQGPLEPIELVNGAVVEQRGAIYSLRRGEHFWTLTFECGGDKEEMYAFGDAPHTTGDVEVANHFTSTHPASIFRRSLTIQKVTSEERLILRPKVVVRYRAGVRSETPVEPGQLRRLARELFSIDLGDAPLLFEETRAT